MIISSSLTKQLGAFLNSVSTYGGVELCLTDEALQPLVRTPHFHYDAHSNALSSNTFVRSVTLEKSLSVRLFGEIDNQDQVKGTIDSVLDLAADGVEYFIRNEAEIQTLSEELLERYQELHVLYEAIEDVRAIFDEQRICEIMLNKALQSVNAEFGAVLFSDNGRMAVRHVEHGLHPTKEYGANDCLSYAERVIESGKHIVLEPSNGTEPSVLGVPITVNNSVIGAMVLMGKAQGEMFTSGDRISLGALAGYLGIAVTTTRLVLESREAEALRREIEFAQHIQQSLLPESLPLLKDLDIAAYCLPSAQVGGDLYGFLKIDDKHWAITVADVAGHGLGAAFIMASLRSILRSEAKSGSTAADVLRRSNNLLSEDTKGNDVYATVFFALYSEPENSLRFSNAGHPAPLLWEAATGEFRELRDGGMALGLFKEEEYGEAILSFHSGDVLVLYTDGVTEAKNSAGIFFGEERLRNVIKENAQKSSQGLLQALLTSLEQFQGGIHGRDDITVLILKSNKSH
jgi:sigma-B regulation protein RsbU (phosphoserine phosphatase)